MGKPEVIPECKGSPGDSQLHNYELIIRADPKNAIFGYGEKERV